MVFVTNAGVAMLLLVRVLVLVSVQAAPSTEPSPAQSSGTANMAEEGDDTVPSTHYQDDLGSDFELARRSRGRGCGRGGSGSRGGSRAGIARAASTSSGSLAATPVSAAIAHGATATSAGDASTSGVEAAALKTESFGHWTSKFRISVHPMYRGYVHVSGAVPPK